MKMPQEDNQKPKSPEKATRKRSRLVRYSVSAIVVLLGALLLGFVALRVVNATIARDSVVDKPISDVLNMADQHKLKTALIQGNEVFATSSTGQKYHAYKEDGQTVTDTLRHDGVAVTIDTGQNTQWGQGVVDILLIALIVGSVYFFFRRGGIGGQVTPFARSKARRFNESRPSILFKDVAGVEEAKMELEGSSSSLNIQRALFLWGRVFPKGYSSLALQAPVRRSS